VKYGADRKKKSHPKPNPRKPHVAPLPTVETLRRLQRVMRGPLQDDALQEMGDRQVRDVGVQRVEPLVYPLKPRPLPNNPYKVQPPEAPPTPAEAVQGLDAVVKHLWKRAQAALRRLR
jgi:hypothetical protein